MRERKFTYCRICEGACGLVAEVENGRLVNLSSDPDHPVSRGYFCPKGKAMLHLQNDPERVRTPLKRTASGWQKVSWDQAVGEISEKLSTIRKNHGNRAVGMYMGNPAAFSYSQAAFVQGFLQGLGTPNFFSAGSQDCNNKFAFSQIFYGSPLIHLFPDIDHTDYLMIIGSNPLVSHMSFVTVPRVAERIKAIEKRGGKLVIIDPRRTETSRVAGEHIFIRPDSDIYFLLSLIRQVLKENLEDETFLKTYSEGLENLREVCEPYTPEKAAGLTGIPTETIIRIAREFSSARTAACYGRLGACLGRFGTMVSWGIEVLNLVTGNLDSPGGMIFHSGHIDLIRSFEFSGMGKSKHRSRIGNHPHLMGSFPAGIMADEILTPGPGQIRAMVIDSGNPVVSCPNSLRLEEAFSRLELLVMVDHYRNETSRFAHYLLPAATFLEREDMPVANIGFQPIPYAQFTEAVVPPDGEQLPQWEIYTRLIERMNLPLLGVIPSKLVFKPARLLGKLPLVGSRISFNPTWLIPGLLLSGGRQVTFRKLKKAPHGLLLKPVKPGELLEKHLRKKGKKLKLVPPEFTAELRKVAEHSEPRPDPEYPFLLIGRRRLGQINSWMQGAPSLKGVANDCLVHPEDASRLNLAGGDMVRVTSRVGSIEIIAKISDEIMPGVVSIPHGYHETRPGDSNFPGKVAGANCNILTDEKDLETFAGMALLNGVHVRVEKIS